MNNVNNLNDLDDKTFMRRLEIGEVTTKPTLNQVKLTNWKNEPKLSDLKYDLEETRQSHSQFLSDLESWENLYNAPKFGGKGHKGSRINPKLVRKQAEWRCPSLSEPFLSTNNLYAVNPLTHEDVERAKQNALILNNQFNTQLNKVGLVDGIIRDVVKNGTSIIRLGWEYQEEKVKEIVPVFEYMPVQSEEELQQLQQQYEQVLALKESEPDSYEQLDEALKAGAEMSLQQGQLFMAQQIGQQEQEKLKPTVNKPTVEICNLRNVYIDPTCKGDLDKAQFVIHSYESSLSDLKRAGYYQNLELLEKSEELSSIGHDKSSDFKFADNARKKLVVYEYWGNWDIDGNGKTKAIVASWVGNVLIRMEENPFPNQIIPFVVFKYLPEKDSIYGIPDAELLEDNQNVLGAVTRGVIDLLGKSANSQTGYSKNFLDATNKIKFRRGEDYEYNPNFDPRVHLYTHKYPEIPNSAMNVIHMMNNEAESLSGVKAFASGGISAAHLGDSATAARGVLDAVSKREMSILRRLSEGFITMGRKIMAMNAEFLSEQEVVRLTNSQFITVRRDDLAGNFDLSLTISTAEADDSKAKELAFLLQTIGNNMGQEMTNLILSEIAHLRKMPELAYKIKHFQPSPPNEQEQQLQQLQLAKLEAEVELLKSQAQENLAKSQVQQAKVGTEMAKAENLQSQADSKTIDTANKLDGTQNQHELDKLALQNKGKLSQQFAKDIGLQNQLGMQQEHDLTKQMFQDSLNQQVNNRHY